MSIDILGISELNGWDRVNLIQMTIISTTEGKNPLEEMVQPSWSTKESEMAVHRCILKKDRMISFIFMANHSIS